MTPNNAIKLSTTRTESNEKKVDILIPSYPTWNEQLFVTMKDLTYNFILPNMKTQTWAGLRYNYKEEHALMSKNAVVTIVSENIVTMFFLLTDFFKFVWVVNLQPH